VGDWESEARLRARLPGGQAERITLLRSKDDGRGGRRKQLAGRKKKKEKKKEEAAGWERVASLLCGFCRWLR